MVQANFDTQKYEDILCHLQKLADTVCQIKLVSLHSSYASG